MTDRVPTPEEAQKFQQWHSAGASPKSVPGADPGDPAWYTQVGRGLARGVASDIPGLSTSQFATQDDAGPIETGSRLVGEYGPMFIPGLDFGLGAKFGTKAAEWALAHGPSLQTLAKVLGPARAQQMIEGLWSAAPKVGETVAQGAIGGVMGDPEHPLRGATTGALTAGAVGAVPKAAKRAATGAAKIGAGIGAYEAGREMLGGRHENWPAYYGAMHTLAPLGGLAAAAMLNRPGLAGAAGSAGRRWWEGDDEQGN